MNNTNRCAKRFSTFTTMCGNPSLICAIRRILISSPGRSPCSNWLMISARTADSTKEKVELYACIKEALMNVHKHAQATSVIISAQTTKEGWQCTVEDDGRGFAGVRMDDHNARQTGYGMEIMRDRAREMGWKID